MKFVALVSGGKDSVAAIWECQRLGHELVAGVHLAPPHEGSERESEEEDESYMYQAAGSEAVRLQIEECLGVPAIVFPRRGTSVRTGLVYHDEDDDDDDDDGGGDGDGTTTANREQQPPRERDRDEVEDLCDALREAKRQFPDVQGVCSGAILSTYQRVRVEHCCCALQLQSLAYLWRWTNQSELLQRMLRGDDDNGGDNLQLEAVLVKTAAPPGLRPHQHLNRSLRELQPHLEALRAQYQFHVCGEGGEYETLVLNASPFKRRLVLDETEIRTTEGDGDDGVGVLVIRACHTEAKGDDSTGVEKDGGDDDSGDGAVEKTKIGTTTIVRRQQPEENKAPISETSAAAKTPTLPAPAPPTVPSSTTTTSTQRQSSSTPRDGPRIVHSDRGIHFLPHVRRLPGGLWAVSELTSPSAAAATTTTTTAPDDADRAVHEALEIFDSLRRLLAALKCTPRDVFFVHLYLQNMSHFDAINRHYRAFFGVVLPPSRSTVAAAGGVVDGCCRVRLDCYVQCGSGAYLRHDGDRNNTAAAATAAASTAVKNPYTRAALQNPHAPLRRVLHVQSRSHWAPVCVGPYSQANAIRGAVQFLAGQIGLVPATMALRREGWTAQLEQSWTNAAAVLDAEGNGSLRGHVLSCLLYVSSRDVFFRDGDDDDDDDDNVVRRMRTICSEQIQRNGGIVPGAVDGTASILDEPPAHGGYEDEETRRELEGDNSDGGDDNNNKQQLRNPCPILVVAIPEMPVGALTEIEIVAATPKAASCLTISDSPVARQELVLPHAHSAAVVTAELPLGWNTGYDFAQSPAKDGEERTVRMDCFVRSLGTHAASFGFVTACLRPPSNETGNSTISRTDLDVRLVLSRMVRLLRDDVAFDMLHVLHLRLYYVAAEADGTLLRSLFQMVLGLAFEESTVPASTVVPVDGMGVLDFSESSDDEQDNSMAPFLAIQAISIDPVHLEQSVWIHHGR